MKTLNYKASTVNSSLAHLLTKNPSDIRPSICSRDLMQFEESLWYLQSVQNVQFWIFGAISRLFKLGDSTPDRDFLMNQAVYSMQLAMQQAAKVSTTALSNILTIWRQSILNTLPGSFSSTDKQDLLQLPLESSTLSVEEKIDQACRQSDLFFTRKLYEATATALRRKPSSNSSSSCSHPKSQVLSLSGFKCPQPQSNIQPFKKGSASRFPPKDRRPSAPSKAVFWK